MNEFIEKLIGRLEEEYNYQKTKALQAGIDVGCGKEPKMITEERYRYKNAQCFDSSIQIVKELAEEYKSMMNYNTLLNDIKSQLNQFIADSNNIDYNRALVEALEVIDKKAEEHKGGWISCKNELPKENGYYLVTYKKNGNLLVGYWLFNGIDFNQTENVEVLYWHPLPAPYNSKGE